MRKGFLALVAVLVLGLALAPCGWAAQKTIKIGINAPTNFLDLGHLQLFGGDGDPIDASVREQVARGAFTAPSDREAHPGGQADERHRILGRLHHAVPVAARVHRQLVIAREIGEHRNSETRLARTFVRGRDLQLSKAFVAHHEKKHGKGKAMSILAHKLGRAVYYMWRRNDAFDEKYFFKV